VRHFLRNTLGLQKLQQLYFKAAFSNFVGFVAGSTVTLLTTYETLERKGLRNLYGILPRKTVVVHRIPEWAEWSLSVLLGYLVMEIVRYILNSNRYLSLIGRLLGEKTPTEIAPAAPRLEKPQ
jgi:hypothetical protein